MLHPPAEILDNQVLLISLAASLVAQSTKFFTGMLQGRQWQWQTIFETGGMPSSHSALVSALAVGIGRTQGWNSPLFAIATVFAVIVMYDAMGIRRAAGKQAQVLNQIVFEVFADDRAGEIDPLKELLGHTPVQVIVGSLLGISLMWCLLPPTIAS
jgi:acid phosphatase family membrane protein YuiD